MKITIEAEEHTASVEFEHYDLTEFSHYLRGILHTVWYPDQVESIVPTEESLSDEFAEVRKLSYKEGFDAGLEKSKDKERLDWVLSHEGRYWLSSREDIDKEMEEAQ